MTRLLEAEFKELIDTHAGILHKVANMYCRVQEDHDDLVQEMMIQIWRALPKYNADYKMSTWLYRIALNVAISSFRKYVSEGRAMQVFRQSTDQNMVFQEHQPTDQLTLLEGFINELHELDRALMLLYLEDKSHAEIAEILGLSVSNVGTKVSRIKEKLKEKFKDTKY